MAVPLVNDFYGMLNQIPHQPTRDLAKLTLDKVNAVDSGLSTLNAGLTAQINAEVAAAIAALPASITTTTTTGGGAVTSVTGGTGITVSPTTGAVVVSLSGSAGVTSITGTANQITASSPTGAVTLSLPAAITVTTGYRIGGTAASGNYLRGDGTNFVSNTIQVADVPTLNQNTTGSAAKLTTARTIAGVSFDGTANISIASTGLSDTANIAYLNASNTFTGTINTFNDLTVAAAHSFSANTINATSGATITFDNSVTLSTGPITPVSIAIGGTSTTPFAITTSMSPAANTSAQLASINGAFILPGSGTTALYAGLKISAMTVTNGAGALTDTASLYVAGAMTATVTGKNYGLWVAGGNIRFGALSLGYVKSDANGLLSIDSVVGNAGFVPQAVTRKPFWSYLDDQNATTTFINFGPTTSNAGTTTNVQDATTGRVRFTTASGDAQSATYRTTTLGTCGTFQHTPTVLLNIFTGSAITTCQIWFGYFDSTTATTAPGTNTSGVLTRAHAAFRFAALVDGTTWHASTGDGTSQNTADTTITISTSTQYLLKIRFITNTSVGFSINGSAETTVAVATSAADATRMVAGIYIFNNGTGFTRFFDVAAMYGDFA